MLSSTTYKTIVYDDTIYANIFRFCNLRTTPVFEADSVGPMNRPKFDTHPKASNLGLLSHILKW